jgi:hypothetical protein
MRDEPPDRTNDLSAQDEILEVMFWLRGEGIASQVGTEDLARFTGATASELERRLARLAALALVSIVATPSGTRYALTGEGIREGGRRFADEFRDLTKPGHGECGDPDCECRQTGNVEDCRHRV